MRGRIAILSVAAAIIIGSFAAVIYAAGQTTAESKRAKWKYTVITHGPYLKKGGSDLQKLQNKGKEGWELASSYRIKGEIIVSILKKRE